MGQVRACRAIPALAGATIPSTLVPHCRAAALPPTHLRLVFEVKNAPLLLRNRVVPALHVALQRRHVAAQPLNHARQLALLGVRGAAGGRVGLFG